MKKVINTLLLTFFLAAPVLAIEKERDSKNGQIISTFEIKAVKVTKAGMICWTSVNENGSLTFSVEQFIYNKWVKVGEVSGIGTPNENSYAVPIALSCGENKFRIGQRNYDKTTRFSMPFSYVSNKESTFFVIKSRNQSLSFTTNTYYLIYNMYGLVVGQGYGNSLNISSYPKGKYFVVYDNKVARFEKKRVLFKNTPFSIVLP